MVMMMMVSEWMNRILFSQMRIRIVRESEKRAHRKVVVAQLRDVEQILIKLMSRM
jgi:hypothetical protein